MKKVKIIGLILIVLIMSFTATTVFSEVFSEKIHGEQLLINIFEKSNANIKETNIYTSLFLDDKFFEMEHMLNILNDMTEHFEIKEEINEIVLEDYSEEDIFDMEQIDYKKNTLYVTKISEIGFNKIYSTYLDEDGNLSTFIIYSYSYEDKSESYIIIDILQNKIYKDMVSLLSRSNEFLQTYGEDIDTTITLVGTYDGKVSINESNKIMTRLLRNVNGEIVERVNDEFFTTITAFTPYLDDAIEYFNKKVNLNMAMRYNAYEDLTYLWIATPLITTTY